MLSRAAVLFFSYATLISTFPVVALELPLPPAGEDVVGQVQVIKARYEDTFAGLGEQYDLGYSELVAANPGVDAWLPGQGTEVIIPTRYILPPGPREGVVINLPEYRLYYYPKDRNVVYTYPLGIGREGWGSPVANTRVTGKIEDPAWYPPESIRKEHAADGDPLPAMVPPGPDNPLGPYKITLGLKSYLIHGSNKNFGIGTRTSHGCFRMYNPNVIELVSMLPVGTPVRIIDQPYKLGLGEGKMMLEAHKPLKDEGDHSIVDKHSMVMKVLHKHSDVPAIVDWNRVREVVAAEYGIPSVIADMPNQPSIAMPTAQRF